MDNMGEKEKKSMFIKLALCVVALIVVMIIGILL